MMESGVLERAMARYNARTKAVAGGNLPEDGTDFVTHSGEDIAASINGFDVDPEKVTHLMHNLCYQLWMEALQHDDPSQAPAIAMHSAFLCAFRLGLFCADEFNAEFNR